MAKASRGIIVNGLVSVQQSRIAATDAIVAPEVKHKKVWHLDVNNKETIDSY